jgi:hypothetical protein
MARAVLTVQVNAMAGITPSYTALNVSDGNSFVWPGKPCWLHVKNSSTIATLTIATPATVGGLAVADLAVTIPATTGDKMIFLGDASLFVQADGSVYLNSDVAVTCAVITAP